MSLTDRIVTGVKATLGANIVYSAANGVLMIVLARFLLTPDEFGLLHYALSIIASVAILGAVGIPSAAARYVTEFAETSPERVRYVVRFSLAVVVGLSVGVGLILALASPAIATALDEPALAPLLLLGLGYVVSRALETTFNRLFQAVNRVDWSARLKAVSGVTRLVGAVALVLAGFGAVGALAGYIVGFGLAAAVGAVVFYRVGYRPFPPSNVIEPGLRRRILEYSVPLTATRGAGVLTKRVDTLLVGFFIGPAAVGYYTIAKQVSEFGSIPAQSLGYTISPTVGEQYAGEDLSRARRVYETSLRYVLLLYVPGMVGLILVAEPVVAQLFGSAYDGAAPVLQVMAGFMLVNAVNQVTSDGLDFLGRARSRAIAKVATGIANFLLNLLLIPMIGVVGAAVATVVTFLCYTLANVYVIHDELALDLRSLGRLLVAVTAIAVVMGITVRMLLPLVSGLVSLLLVVGVGVAVWGVLATLGGLLDVDRVRLIFT
ncbi:oligosaccharide flippase family protein [Halobellus sp. GM3]|uniref:oligosaccharide flippase family protein n=1 Tax=Halobellus sp. GM3 TaxID=3458410 RepID=UPI00403E2320